MGPTRIKMKSLTISKSGRGGNDTRVVASYWLAQGAKLTNVATGKLVATSPVAVSKAMRRVRRELSHNPNGTISEWVLALRESK